VHVYVCRCRGRACENSYAFGEKSMVAIDREEVLWETLVGIFQIRIRYRMSFTVVLPRLQLWHLYCMVSLQSVGDMHAQVS
jgi:hypothetical protein